MVVASCGASSDIASSESNSGSNSGSSSGSNSGFSESDLGGIWIGRLTPNNINDKLLLFYLNVADDGLVINAADSVGNEWEGINSSILVNFLSSGNLSMDFFSDLGTNKLHMQGQMTDSMTSIEGDYDSINLAGDSVAGSFELILSSGDEQFANIDFSGIWEGGFGIGRRQNERLLTFELDQAGQVISGSLVNTSDGEEIHHYSAGAGSFAIDDTVNGRIDNFVVVADDGAIAECYFLLVDIDLGLIAGVGTDSELGAAVIEVRR